MFFKRNSNKASEHVQQPQPQTAPKATRPLSEMVKEFNERIALKRFVGYVIENDMDLNALIFHIRCIIEEANQASDRIYRVSNETMKKELDVLSSIGFFVRVPIKSSIQAGRSLQSNPYAAAYQCLITNQQYDEFLSLREKMQESQRATAIQEKALSLRQIRNVFDYYKSNADLMKAVRNSKELLNRLAALYIEIFAMPLEINTPPKPLPGMGNSASAPSYYYYRPTYFDCGLLSRQELDSFECMKRLNAFTWFNLSTKNPNRALYIELIGLWGSVVHKDDSLLRTLTNPQLAKAYLNLRQSFSDVYNKVSFLYESLVSYGLIPVNTPIHRSAFHLLLYDVWYNATVELYTSIGPQDASFVDSASTGELIAFLRKKNFNDSMVAYFLAGRDYLHGTLSPMPDLINKYQKYIAQSNEEMAKKQYVEQLLKGGPVVKFYTIEDIDQIEPYTFEEVIAALFRRLGYEASATKKSGDQGVDIIATKSTTRIAIQAKCYPNSVVGNSAVQAVVAGMKYYNANKACVITNSTYTQSAIDLAKVNSVELWDRAKLQSMLQQYPVEKS